MRKITLALAAQLLNSSGNYPHLPIQGYSVDSRLLKTGDLFFALKGERVDGHAYLKEAKEKGAVAAVVSKGYPRSIELPLIVVEDPLYALQELARALLLQTKSSVVAITGSVGKTTTKEFCKTLLSLKFKVASSPGNSNSQIGVPLAILNHTTGEEEIIVLEMGMTHLGQLTRLVQIAPPDVAVITHVSYVHACNFESIDEIARAKSEILSHPNTQLGIINRDIPLFDEVSQKGASQKLSYALTSHLADYYWEDLGHVLKSSLEKKDVIFEPFSIPGNHNFGNLLAAILVARHFKMEWEEIKRGVSGLTLPERRLQYIRRNEILFLNDSYNASELSVKAALEVLQSPSEKGRKIAVLGSMKELGKFSDECHFRVGVHALDFVEILCCLGEECLPMIEVWEKLGRPVFLFKTRIELAAFLKETLKPTDVVLLKGSRSHELWKVLEEI